MTSLGKATPPTSKVHVAILDDHQSIIDGYYYRLERRPEIEVVGAVTFGEALEDLLAHASVDVLILDVSVPTSPTNVNPYPILHIIPKLLQSYPSLAVLVISMLSDRALIRAVLDTGASGYILKDDLATLRELPSVILAVARGGIHFSPQAYQLLRKQALQSGEALLTPRQLEALSLSAAYPGESLAALASRLGVSNSTLRNLLSNAYLRLQVHNRTEAILRSRELGLITPVASTHAD